MDPAAAERLKKLQMVCYRIAFQLMLKILDHLGLTWI